MSIYRVLELNKKGDVIEIVKSELVEYNLSSGLASELLVDSHSDINALIYTEPTMSTTFWGVRHLVIGNHIHTWEHGSTALVDYLKDCKVSDELKELLRGVYAKAKVELLVDINDIDVDIKRKEESINKLKLEKEAKQELLKKL